MKSLLSFLVLLSTYCYCEQLLGGWSLSNDEALKQDCIKKALVHIHGAQVGDDVQSQVSKHICYTQIVNGLNIKCYFVLQKQKWQCSYYKSFVQTLDTQLEECKQVEDEQETEKNADEDAIEELAASNDDEKEKQPASSNERGNEEDDEAKIDAMNKEVSNQNANAEEEQQY